MYSVRFVELWVKVLECLALLFLCSAGKGREGKGPGGRGMVRKGKEEMDEVGS